MVLLFHYVENMHNVLLPGEFEVNDHRCCIKLWPSESLGNLILSITMIYYVYFLIFTYVNLKFTLNKIIQFNSIDNFILLINSFDLLIDLDQSFNQNYIKIAIVELELDLYRNWWSNSDCLESKSSTIWFGNPNCLSLDWIV